MTDEEVDKFLETHWAGILSLCDSEQRAYSVPESFGYHEGVLYFHLLYHPESSQKMQFIESTERATFTVMDMSSFESVIVKGKLEEVPEEEELIGGVHVAEQASFPTLNIHPELDLNELDSSVYRLVPTEVTGRRFTPECK